MKLKVSYEIEINVEFKDPDKANEYFLSTAFNRLSAIGYYFETLGDVAGVITQIILRDGLNKAIYEIEEIGLFHRAIDGRLLSISPRTGPIVISYDQPYYSSIDVD